MFSFFLYTYQIDEGHHSSTRFFLLLFHRRESPNPPISFIFKSDQYLVSMKTKECHEFISRTIDESKDVNNCLSRRLSVWISALNYVYR